ncbi:hypothetical protein [Mesorhizobium sp.]|uniref:hypothetical protein n=1 Tax=Mesorhizobium sp. TaxID=1871066 RepID=UPI000FE55A80|nr:hypothetical protein [Mesorhizobium sp.]RWM45522.1 MAG: hypothetical protein EOR76_21055 [Mesorhizobium sp.]RWM58157.1 MAG: hypothetical protein EOR79_14130 [Mesorhizobium sp.]RWM58677.1 MAG: hypothetical protein EOR78_06145 [Mesorhizobium sp.]TIO70023.1 MAG: hypothetical protein E5X85_07675 [Mesorhizobium sp.]
MMVETGFMPYSDATLSNAEFAGFNSPHASLAAYEEIGPQGALSSRPGLAQAVASATIISAKNTREFMSFSPPSESRSPAPCPGSMPAISAPVANDLL